MLPLTAHAASRMEERGVTVPMLAAVVFSGKVEPGLEPGTVCLSLCGLRVVASRDTHTVITVLYPRPPKARLNPKRRARMPGQLRRRIEREERHAGRCW